VHRPHYTPRQRLLFAFCGVFCLDGALTVRRRQHDIGAPCKLARGVPVVQQSLKLAAVGGAKVKAGVRASYPTTIPQAGRRPESYVRCRTLG
jgi:hypothetical protein